MVFCRGCGKEIHESASICPQCGAPQKSVSGDGTLWLPIPGLVLGVLCVMALLDDSGWDQDSWAGVMLFALIATTLGIISVCVQKKGKKMAIIAIVSGAIAVLGLIGIYDSVTH